MRIHHLNCGTMRPYAGGLVNATATSIFARGRCVIHCLLVETEAGLALVDTGWGARDYASPSGAVRLFTRIMGCICDPEETAIRQVARLGYAPSDVRHIFVTHMHLDHAGGLPDFPEAIVHVYAPELEAALHPRTLMERWAYRPEHWAHHPRWEAHDLQGDDWFGLPSTPPIAVGETTFVIIPFVGHTRGHCAIAVRTDEGWLVHCGDAYAYHGKVHPTDPHTPPGSKWLEAILRASASASKSYETQIRELLRPHGDEIQTFCSHDPHEFDRYQQ
jgi:glyoxylase-like metal-dependent hydrolase (beta-lactamase superfamily II)